MSLPDKIRAQGQSGQRQAVLRILGNAASALDFAMAQDLTEYPGFTVTVPAPGIGRHVEAPAGSGRLGPRSTVRTQRRQKPDHVFDRDTGGATGARPHTLFKLVLIVPRNLGTPLRLCFDLDLTT